MKKITSLLLLIFALCTYTFAQDFITVSGRVKGLKNRALPQVTVVDKASAVATVTNGDGDFSLKVPTSSGRDSVEFSYVGYLSQMVAVADLLAEEGRAVVELARDHYVVEGVGVTIKDASDFIDDVFQRRTINYPLKRSPKTAFYREMVKKRNSYATLTETVVDIDKSGYNSQISDRASIYKGRSLRDRRFTDTLFVKLQGGIVSALSLDVMKQDGMVFTDKPSDEYRFWFERPTTIDGRKIYVVSFNQRSRLPQDMLFRGNLYVDSISRAVVRAELNLNVEDHESEAKSLIRKCPKGVEIDVTGVNFVISYRQIADKWHFDYCNSELMLRCHIGRRLFKNNYTITSEMVVTEHDTKRERIAFADRVKYNDMIYESAQAFNDDDFWEDYNVIEHELSINAIVERFKRQLGRERR